MKKLVIVVLMVLLSVNVFSQAFARLYESILDQNERIIFKDGDNVIDIASTMGSPYLTEIFVSGIVHAKASDEHLGHQMRYNVYNDEMEVKNLINNTIVVLKKERNLSCTLLNKEFQYLNYTDVEGNVIKGYFQKITDDPVSLMLKYTCKYHKKKEPKPPVFISTQAKFVTEATYFMLKSNQLTLLPTKKNAFVKIFGKHKKDIKLYIKENKIDISKKRDMIRVIKYYNTLL